MALGIERFALEGNPGISSGAPKTDWVGKWIWVPDHAGYSWRNSYALFRRRFSANGEIRVDIAADTRYELFLDGRRVDRGTAPSPVAYKTFDTHLLSVQPGEHVLAVLVHHIGEACASAHTARPGLIVDVGDAFGARFGSDSDWRVLAGRAFEQDLPLMMSHFGHYEVCDFRKIPSGWTDVAFDDNDWLCAQVIGQAGCEPWLKLIPRDIPLLRTTVVPAARITLRGTFEGGRSTEPTVAEEM